MKLLHLISRILPRTIMCYSSTGAFLVGAVNRPSNPSFKKPVPIAKYWSWPSVLLLPPKISFAMVGSHLPRLKKLKQLSQRWTDSLSFAAMPILRSLSSSLKTSLSSSNWFPLANLVPSDVLSKLLTLRASLSIFCIAKKYVKYWTSAITSIRIPFFPLSNTSFINMKTTIALTWPALNLICWSIFFAMFTSFATTALANSILWTNSTVDAVPFIYALIFQDIWLSRFIPTLPPLALLPLP